MLEFSIKKQHALKPTQIDQFEVLKSACQRYDGYLPPLHAALLLQLSAYPSTLLAYSEGNLIGFLRVFFFYDENVEVVLLVDPKNRRQGLGTSLMQHAKPLLKNERIRAVLFALPAKTNHWLSDFDASYESTEFLLKNDLQQLPERNDLNRVSIAQQDDIPDILELDESCFAGSNLSKDRVETLISKPAYYLTVIRDGKKVIGKCHLHFVNTTAAIYDVAVATSYRCKGYASTLVCEALAQAKAKGMDSVSLDVKSNNQQAVSLYHKLGFTTQATHHYWRLPVSNMD